MAYVGTHRPRSEEKFAPTPAPVNLPGTREKSSEVGYSSANVRARPALLAASPVRVTLERRTCDGGWGTMNTAGYYVVDLPSHSNRSTPRPFALLQPLSLPPPRKNQDTDDLLPFKLST